MGILYGIGYTPSQYAVDNYDLNIYGLEYLFSYFTGIFLMSTILVLIYTAFRKNNPSVYPSCIVPSFVGGFLWGVGQSFFFLANYFLSFLVSFPLVGFLSSLVACLWGFIKYKEIIGRENRVIFITGSVIYAFGCGSIVLSDSFK